MNLLKIIDKNINELIPYKKNPRYNIDAIDEVAESIRKYGFKVPIIIDINNIIICGHTRYEASKKIGLKLIPCIIASDLSEEQTKAFRLVDNKVAEFSSWDYEKLIKEIEKIDDDFINNLHFIENLENISDEDFIINSEKLKEKNEKKFICPKCGETFI